MTELIWKSGTGFDLFASLVVLHNPAIFGLRRSWAAGVRQRLSPPNQVFLEKYQSCSQFPLGWLAGTQGRMDASDILKTISDIPAEERLRHLALNNQIEFATRECLMGIASKKDWQEEDLDFLDQHYRVGDIPLKRRNLQNLVEIWSNPAASGENLLSALKDYHTVFFVEEEHRILPVLEEALIQGEQIAKSMGIEEILEKLSHGIHFEPIGQYSQITLIPSFWSSPFIFLDKSEDGNLIILYGARPENMSLVPGVNPPPHLVSTLKALADPTRLRILHLLSEESRSSSEIARELRLRLPTVVHHLRILRLAELIQITVSEKDKRYQTHHATLDGLQNSLKGFIETKGTHD